MGFLHPGSQDWQFDGNYEARNEDVNLNTAFQIVDELQAPPKIHMVKIKSPEMEPEPASEQQPSTTVSLSTVSTTTSTPETDTQQHQEPTHDADQSVPLDFSQRVSTSFQFLLIEPYFNKQVSCVHSVT